jgi:hypothetical protein
MLSALESAFSFAKTKARTRVARLTPNGTVPHIIPCQRGGFSGEGIFVAGGTLIVLHTVVSP